MALLEKYRRLSTGDKKSAHIFHDTLLASAVLDELAPEPSIRVYEKHGDLTHNKAELVKRTD